jgi:hypothetical protein
LHQLSLVVFVFEFVHSFFCLGVCHALPGILAFVELNLCIFDFTFSYEVPGIGKSTSFLNFLFYAALGCKRCTFPWFQCLSPLMPHHSQCKCQSFSKISLFCNKRGKSWYWRRTTFLCWWLEPSPSISSSCAWKGNGPKLQLSPRR